MAAVPFQKLDSLGIISQRGLSITKTEYTLYARFIRKSAGVNQQKQVRDFIESAIREKMSQSKLTRRCGHERSKHREH